MNENKAALIIIIVLLIISVPTSAIAILYKFFYKEEEVTPTVIVNKEFFQDGKLNFYDFGILVGTYTCKNPNGYCGWAYESIDDEGYALNYYDDYSVDMIQLINSRYAFIVDSNDVTDEYHRNAGIILYDVVESKEVANYIAVKNYTVGLENDYYIVENLDQKWGVIQLSPNGIFPIIPFEYDFIGVQNEIANASTKLVADSFVVQKNSSWYIIDPTGTEISTSFSGQIYTYHNNVLAVRNSVNNSLYLYNYDGTLLLGGQYFLDAKFYSKYVGVISTNGVFSLMNYNNNQQVTSSPYNVSSLSFVKVVTKEDGSLDLFINDNFVENVN